MVRPRIALLALALTLAAAEAPAQTVTWGGGFPNDKFNVATNWVGGTVSVGYTSGADTLVFDDNSDSYLNLNVSGVSLLQLQVTDTTGNGDYANITGANSLTLGSGGIMLTSPGPGASSLDLNVPVVLAANQTWTGGYLVANGAVSGTGSLTLNGGNYNTYVLNSGSNSFSGGVTVSGATTTLSIATTGTPLGTGPLALGDGTILAPADSTAVSLANNVTFGDGTNGSPVVIGANPYSSYPRATTVTFTGNVTLNINGTSGNDSEIDLTPYSTATFTGSLAGSAAGVCLDFGTTGSGTDNNSLLVVKSPSITNVSRLDLEDNATVVFDGGIAQLSGLAYAIGTTSTTYLGLGATYEGHVASFISSYTSPASFTGTLGFDTTAGGTSTFSDAVDLTGFTDGNFIGLGSATSAILTGQITPPGGAAGTSYYFGGGGGTLTVESPLVDGAGSRNLVLAPGNGPLTLILSGSSTAMYSGGSYVYGGALIFDTPIPSGGLYAGISSTNWGYIGNTPNSGISDASPQSFVNMFVSDGPFYGVIGFDTLSSARTITGTIDLSDLPQGRFFLGSATSVTFAGSITPTDNVYQFAGVKGGQVTVEPAALTDSSASVVIGLAQPIESFGSQSSVTMVGNNTYSGTTTLQSGYLYVSVVNAGDNPISTGTLIVPNPSCPSGWVATLAATGGQPVALSNPIEIPNNGLALNTGSSTTLTLNGAISDDASSSGQLGIFGPVVLGGNNTYSGGTFISNANVTVNSDTGLGSGSLTANGSTLSFTSPAPVLDEVSLRGTTASFSGNAVLYDLQMAQSTLSFAPDTTPSIIGLQSDAPGSGNVIDIGSGATLSLSLNEDPEFHGTLEGSGNLVISGGGQLDLRGSSPSFSGTTMIGLNTLVAASNNSALGTGPVVVNGALATNTGVTIANPITLIDGGTIAGYGTYSPPAETITFQNSSKLVPGAVLFNSGSSNLPAVGTLSFGPGASLAFGPAGNMAFSLMDANGAAGVGYSTLDLAGSLNITAAPATPFNIYLFSYAPGTNTPEETQAANFNSAQAYSWTLLSAAGGITNFSANAFNVFLSYDSTTTFLNSPGVGVFYVSQVGNDLMLNFTPVPEPSTWALMASGLFALGAAVRRRSR
jgi:hypothetical protein